MVGSITGGSFQDLRGRRASLALGSFISAIAAAICFVSNQPASIEARRAVFFTGKLIQGFAIGALVCVAQTYMSEVLPTDLRGPILAFFPIFTLLGQLTGAVVMYSCLKYTSSWSYLICFASQWAFSVAAFALALALPESPIWLLRRQKYEDARKAQQRLITIRVDISSILENLQKSIDAEEEIHRIQHITYLDCFKGTDLRRTWIVVLASSLPQLFGIVLLANASYFMQIVGMSAVDSITFLILGIGLGLISNVASLWVLHSFGRRFLALLSLGVTTLLWLAMGIAGCFSGVVMIWLVDRP